MESSEQERRYDATMSEFGPAVGRIAATFEHDPARRAELMQQIQIALWRSLGVFDGRCSLRTWVWRVAHNVAASHVARIHKERTRFTTLDRIDELCAFVDQEARSADRILLERLIAVIRTLQPPDAQVMLLYLEGEDARQIAEVTGVSPSAVATKIHRIKRALARRFDSQGGKK